MIKTNITYYFSNFIIVHRSFYLLLFEKQLDYKYGFFDSDIGTDNVRAESVI